MTSTASISGGPPGTATTATTWDAAHEEYCRTNHTLAATLQQITSKYPEGEEVPFSFPKKKTWLTTTKQAASLLEHGEIDPSDTPRASSSTASSIFGYVRGFLGYGGGGLDDDDAGENGDADSDGDDGDGLWSDKDYKTRIYNNNIVRNCTRVLTECAASSTIELGGLETIHDDNNSINKDMAIIPLNEWDTWVSSQARRQTIYSSTSATKKNEWNDFVANLSSKDKQFLLHVVVEMNYAKIVNGVDRLVASSSSLSSDKSKGSKGNEVIVFCGTGRLDGEFQEKKIKNYVALWEIGTTLQRLERSIKECEKKRDHYKIKAIRFRDAGNSKQGVYMLKLSRAYDGQINLKVQQEVNLQNVRISIEQMHQNKDNVDMMKDAAGLLRNARANLDISPEEIEQIREDFDSELDFQSELEQAVVSSSQSMMVSTSADDDAALLDELMGMIDADEAAGDGSSGTGGGGDSTDKKAADKQLEDLERRLDALKVNSSSSSSSVKENEPNTVVAAK